MNDLIIYIIVGILWLIFSVLGKKQKQQQRQRTKPDGLSLEDALREYELARRGGEPMATPPPVPPLQPPAVPEPVPSRWPDEFQGYQTTFADDTFRQPAQPVMRKPAPAAPSVKPATKKSRVPTSKITARLRNPQSAQVAVVLSEVLGKPRAHRPPVGFPGMHNP